MNFFFSFVIVSLMSWKSFGQEPPAPDANSDNRNGNEWNRNGNDNGFGGTPPQEPPATVVETTTTTTTSSFTVSQGPNPPSPRPLNCDDFKCTPSVVNEPEGNNPMVVRSKLINPTSTNCNEKTAPAARPCQYKTSTVSNMCYGIYCLTVEPGNDYCICAPDQVDYQCTTYKPGSCDSATGLLNGQRAFKAENKRWRQRQNPDHGSVYARHIAVSGTDCIRMCQWAPGRCNSINYGNLNGVQLCELLSVVVTNGSILQQYLVDSPGWTYTNVVGKAAAV